MYENSTSASTATVCNSNIYDRLGKHFVIQFPQYIIPLVIFRVCILVWRDFRTMWKDLRTTRYSIPSWVKLSDQMWLNSWCYLSVQCRVRYVLKLYVSTYVHVNLHTYGLTCIIIVIAITTRLCMYSLFIVLIAYLSCIRRLFVYYILYHFSFFFTFNHYVS